MKDSSIITFPMIFDGLNRFPKHLFYEGDTSLLKKRCITFVGTRNITEYGKWCIDHLLGKFLVELDIAIVSGLARGVDAYVHQTCLQRGISTIAIVPGSINSAIPKCNLEIFNQLKQKGLILAEYPEGTVLGKEMFVLRNRLLAGISDSVIVVEAGIGSGSLITANFAVEFNRDLYIIPGNINNNMSHGCNLLASMGAGIITCLDDFKRVCGIENDQVLLKV